MKSLTTVLRHIQRGNLSFCEGEQALQTYLEKSPKLSSADFSWQAWAHFTYLQAINMNIEDHGPVYLVGVWPVSFNSYEIESFLLNEFLGELSSKCRLGNLIRLYLKS